MLAASRVSRSARAWAIVTPGLSRPKTAQVDMLRSRWLAVGDGQGGEKVDLDVYGINERLRQDAGDGVWLSVESDDRAQDVGTRMKMIAPELVREQSRLGSVRKFFFRPKCAADRGGDGERRQKVRGNAAGVYLGGVRASQQHHVAEARLRRSQMLKDAIVAAPRHVIRRRNEFAAHTGEADRHPHKLSGAGIGQRPQENGIGNTEDGGRRADSQRQREHRRDRKRGRAAQNTGGISQVLPETFEGPEPAHRARIFHDECLAAEQPPRLRFSLLARHPALHQLLGFDREVGFEFRFEIGLGCRLMKKTPPHGFTP